ncbi:hypothetical protein T484DRAFT_1846316 [Baffinella frigidus]|nr:hypothetical protein T484DRAFT_1846316 [Cryptophyta sp. CCMP2293]
MAFLLCYAVSAGATHGLLVLGLTVRLLVLGLTVRGISDGMAAANRLSGGWACEEAERDDSDGDGEGGGDGQGGARDGDGEGAAAVGVRVSRTARLVADGMRVGGRMALAGVVGSAVGGAVAAGAWA